MLGAGKNNLLEASSVTSSLVLDERSVEISVLYGSLPNISNGMGT